MQRPTMQYPAPPLSAASATAIQPVKEATEIQYAPDPAFALHKHHQSLTNNSPSTQPALSPAAIHGSLAR